MQNRLAEELQFSGYELLALNQWNPDSLLESSIPEEIILAILADYPPEQAKEVIQRILKRLDSIRLKPDVLKKYLFHLTTLARLRKLENKTTFEVQAMPIEYDIETDGLYLQGLEKGQSEGFVKGRNEGLKKGKQEGFQEGKQKAIEAFLIRGQLSEQDIADTLEVSLEFVMQIKRSVNKL
jgi:predicted transposase YdaD